MYLPEMIAKLQASDAVGTFLAVKPSQSFHLVGWRRTGTCSQSSRCANPDILINGGYFVFRQTIFDYMREGDELVEAPFARLMQDRKLLANRGERFWCMDTFKEQQELTDIYNSGKAPWEIWKSKAGAERR